MLLGGSEGDDALFFSFFSFFSSLLLSSSTRSSRRFYPRRPSGQAVVTGVISSSPRYVPSIFIARRVQLSTARRLSPNVANSRSRAFR